MAIFRQFLENTVMRLERTGSAEPGPRPARPKVARSEPDVVFCRSGWADRSTPTTSSRSTRFIDQEDALAAYAASADQLLPKRRGRL